MHEKGRTGACVPVLLGKLGRLLFLLVLLVKAQSRKDCCTLFSNCIELGGIQSERLKDGRRHLGGFDEAGHRAVIEIRIRKQYDHIGVVAAVSLLEMNGSAIGLGQIFYGPSLETMFNAPGLPPNGVTELGSSGAVKLLRSSTPDAL